MRGFIVALSVFYAALAGLLFFAQDYCYISKGIDAGIKANYWLVGVGVALQIGHLLAILFLSVRGGAVIFSRGQGFSTALLLFLIISFLGYGPVRHGALQGDKVRAFFSEGDSCSDLFYVISSAYGF